MDTLDKPLLSDTVVARSATFVQGGTITGFGGHLARALQLTLLTGLVVGPAVTLYHFYGAVPMAPSPQSGGSCSSPIVAGHVNVNIDGKKTLMTLVSSQPSALTVSADSSTFVVPYGARAYLVTDPCPQQWTPDLFFDSPFVLTNRQFSARVSLAQISCGCAGTVYFASMPAYAEDGSLDPGPDGDYYCIADTLNGCPEMDILGEQWCFEAKNEFTLGSNKLASMYMLSSLPLSRIILFLPLQRPTTCRCRWLRTCVWATR